MRVRIIKPVATGYGGFAVGTVADVPDKVAKQWCKDGIAMQDKSLDGPKETKAVPEVKAEDNNFSSRIDNLKRNFG